MLMSKIPRERETYKCKILPLQSCGPKIVNQRTLALKCPALNSLWGGCLLNQLVHFEYRQQYGQNDDQHNYAHADDEAGLQDAQ